MKKLITGLAMSVLTTSVVASDVIANTDNKYKNTTPNCAIGNITHDDGCCSVVIPHEQSNSSRRGFGCEDDAIIDVLWVYTQQALDYIGNEEGVLLQCQIAVDDANETFANTELPFSVRIVGLHYTDYTETADYLSHLQNPNDGYMDEVHPLRDAKAADIVVLITETGSCGLAYVSPSNPAYGFQECSAGCLVEDWAHPFRHELGHNLGSQHYTTDTYGYFSWSSGHRLTPDGGEEIGTAMGGNSIPHYSNPNVYYGGVPTGHPIGPDEEADNYSAFMVTVPMVADFRCSEIACYSDIDLDGVVGVTDLLNVIDSWGNCAACSADIAFDGVVDVLDLLMVVEDWGVCDSYINTWIVDNDGGADFDNIQAAVDAASDGDEIIVMPGVYTSTHKGYVINTLGKEITLRSSNPADPEVVSNTIIDGENSRRCIVCVGNENYNTVVDGLTFAYGFGVAFDFNDDGEIHWWEKDGGCLYSWSIGPTFSNCIFRNNLADHGGAVRLFWSDSTFTNCTFTDNSTVYSGGAIYNDISKPTFTNCIFSNNTADSGGAIIDFGSAQLNNCIFTNNLATIEGGAITVIGDDADMPTITGTIFCGNVPGHINSNYWIDGGANIFMDICSNDDCNKNGIVDFQDIINGYSLDDNENGIPDECE